MPHKEIFAALGEGQTLLLDDGKVSLKVESHGADFADCRVAVAGDLSDRKGVNVPGAVLPISPLTKKDRADLAFALNCGVDWLALSFVQRPEDVAEARRLIQGRAALLSKIEKPAALDHLDELVELSGRHHGGTRRSGGGDAAAACATLAEEDRPQVPADGQARSWWRPRCWNR